MVLIGFYRSGVYRYRQGATAVLEKSERKFEVISQSTSRAESMDV